MNKKGGSFNAGVWFIGVMIYFVFFILIVHGTTSLDEETADSDLVEIELEGVNFDTLIGTNYCTSPRFGYNAQTGELTEYNRRNRDKLFCEESPGALSQSECNDIAGCSWENVTTGFWFWESTESASCIGDINATEYDIEMTDPLIGRPRVKSHNNTGIYGTYTPFSDPNVCEHPEVLYNKTLCDLFVCTWESATPDATFNSVGSIYSTVGDVFTFRHDFGFSNSTFAFIVNFFT